MMIVADHAEVHFLITILLIKNIQKNQLGSYQVIMGSKLKDDISSENYCVDVVSEIIHFMEREVTFVFHSLDKVYTSLYDLFNQNYRKNGDQNYCRIVQGTISKVLHRVHPKFKVVLFMTNKNLNETDEPLINRFERYLLTKEYFEDESIKRRLKVLQKIRNLVWFRQGFHQKH